MKQELSVEILRILNFQIPKPSLFRIVLRKFDSDIRFYWYL